MTTQKSPGSALPLWALLPPARNWWEVYLLALCVFSGLSSLLWPQTVTPNLDRHLPSLVLSGWGWCLLTGGLVALAGVIIGPRPVGILIERSGLLVLLGACVAYPVALLMIVGSHGLPQALTIAVFAVVVMQRIVRVTRLVHLMTRPRGDAS